MRLETFLRKSLRLQAHLVTRVQEAAGQAGVIEARIDRLGKRRLRCSECGGTCQQVRDRRPERRWRDLSLRGWTLVLVYAPFRVICPRCGVRVEKVPWAGRWERLTHALCSALARLAKELPWNRVASHFGLDWKSVATAVRRAVAWGQAQLRWKPLPVIGFDEVSRSKGQSYLTIVYDLERRRLVWAGPDRTRETADAFFVWLGRRKSRGIRAVCCDMWAAYVESIKEHLPEARIVFDRFHMVRHLNAAVDEVRRITWRRLSGPDRTRFKRTRWLWLSNPWNLEPEQKRQLSALCRRNAPIVRAYYLKEDFQHFWDYQQEGWAARHLQQWTWWASHSRLEPFKRLARMVRRHWDGLLAWTKTRISNGALEGMNAKVSLIRHRAHGFRNVQNFIANLYHCCSKLPEEPRTLFG